MDELNIDFRTPSRLWALGSKRERMRWAITNGIFKLGKIIKFQDSWIFIHLSYIYFLSMEKFRELIKS